jgi:hypothetical protein
LGKPREVEQAEPHNDDTDDGRDAEDLLAFDA